MPTPATGEATTAELERALALHRSVGVALSKATRITLGFCEVSQLKDAVNCLNEALTAAWALRDLEASLSLRREDALRARVAQLTDEFAALDARLDALSDQTSGSRVIGPLPRLGPRPLPADPKLVDEAIAELHRALDAREAGKG